MELVPRGVCTGFGCAILHQHHMKREVHEEVVRQLSLPVGACPHPRQLLERYGSDGLTREALVSISSQENQYKVIKSNHLVKQRIQSYTDRYLSGEDILALSVEADFPPCMLMRRILELLLQGSKQVVGEVMKQPGRICMLLDNPELAPALMAHVTTRCCSAQQQDAAACADDNSQAAQQSQQHQQLGVYQEGSLLQPQDTSVTDEAHTGKKLSTCNEGSHPATSPAQPANSCHEQLQPGHVSRQQAQPVVGACCHQCRHCVVAELQHDICRCVLADSSYSVLCDAARQAAGLEYELLLADKLKAAGVDWFWTEAQLRAQGYFKTPDVRLQVPIAVRARSRCKPGAATTDSSPAGMEADSSWHVVCWIDSKATFGDDRIHNKQLEEQYATYVNRYGPGLVIYWFGFIDDLDTHADVLLMDHFPNKDELHVLPQAQLPPTYAMPTALQTSSQMTAACS